MYKSKQYALKLTPKPVLTYTPASVVMPQLLRAVAWGGDTRLEKGDTWGWVTRARRKQEPCYLILKHVCERVSQMFWCYPYACGFLRSEEPSNSSHKTFLIQKAF